MHPCSLRDCKTTKVQSWRFKKNSAAFNCIRMPFLTIAIAKLLKGQLFTQRGLIIVSNQRLLQVNVFCFVNLIQLPIENMTQMKFSLSDFSFKSNEHPHIYFPSIWFEVHGEMTKEGSDGLIFVLKLPQMFYISTLTSMAFTIIILTICACQSFCQSIQKQFSSVPSDEEFCNSNSTEDNSVTDMTEKEPSEKDLFVSNIIKNPKA